MMREFEDRVSGDPTATGRAGERALAFVAWGFLAMLLYGAVSPLIS